MNKKGQEAAKTIGDLLIAIAGGIIVLGIVLLLLSFVNPIAGGYACGVNIEIYAATVSATKGLLGSPILLCNQYRDPVKINAANFNACPGLADFCSGAKGTLRDECYQQCARVQINALTDTCWGIGGKGDKDLRGPWWGRLGEIVFEGISDAISKALDDAAHALGKVAGREITIGNRTIEVSESATTPTRNVILRCNRFQVVNPARTSNGQPFIFKDSLWGQSSYYSADDTACRQLGLLPPCYLGGTDVKAAQADPATGKSEISDSNLWKLNYEIETPRQVCYLSYAQFKNKDGNDFNYAVIRSCKGWNPYGGTTRFIN